jgi:hypothetical protein
LKISVADAPNPLIYSRLKARQLLTFLKTKSTLRAIFPRGVRLMVFV